VERGAPRERSIDADDLRVARETIHRDLRGRSRENAEQDGRRGSRIRVGLVETNNGGVAQVLEGQETPAREKLQSGTGHPQSGALRIGFDDEPRFTGLAMLSRLKEADESVLVTAKR
jgi:hypothetical protein